MSGRIEDNRRIEDGQQLSVTNIAAAEELVDFSRIHRSPSVQTGTTTSRVCYGSTRKQRRGNGRTKWSPAYRCKQIARFNESCDGIARSSARRPIVEPMIYPGVCCGHRDCVVQFPVMTPKTMGWLWSLRETGGVKINRNWRPGAIPKSVMAVMEMTRAKPTSSPDDQLSVTTTATRVKKAQPLPSNVRSMQVDRPVKVQSGDGGTARNYSRSTGQHTAGTADNPPRQHHDNAKRHTVAAARHDDKKPVVSVKSHGGQYLVTMNPMPHRDQDGELVWPKNVEPVRLRLSQRGDRGGSVTSESSVDIELAPMQERKHRPNNRRARDGS